MNSLENQGELLKDFATLKKGREFLEKIFLMIYLRENWFELHTMKYYGLKLKSMRNHDSFSH